MAGGLAQVWAFFLFYKAQTPGRIMSPKRGGLYVYDTVALQPLSFIILNE